MDQIFGDRLRILRKRRGMTQADLAQALGVTVQTIVRYEGLRLEEVRPARLHAIAEALGVGESELTGESDSPDEADIQLLTRGLRNMDPVQRKNLIQLMMPLVMQYQRNSVGSIFAENISMSDGVPSGQMASVAESAIHPECTN